LLAGLPGAGKSTLAAALETRLGAITLSKDIVRAALFPAATLDYSEEQNDICMHAVYAAATYLSRSERAPEFILLDGRTFARSSHIAAATAAAERAGAGWRILLLQCSEETALERIRASRAIHPAQDRDEVLYQRVKAEFEPIRQPHLVLDTDQPLEQCAAQAVAYLTQDSQRS